MSPTCGKTVYVHQGFLSLFTQIYGQIQTILTKYGSGINTVLIAGHSLGAAIAALSSLYFCQTYPVVTYTYAKPRIGNIAYQQCVNQYLPNRFWRVENTDDIVPQVPWSVTPNFSNNTVPWIYEHEGQATTFTANMQSLLLNHLMQTYMLYLSGTGF